MKLLAIRQQLDGLLKADPQIDQDVLSLFTLLVQYLEDQHSTLQPLPEDYLFEADLGRALFTEAADAMVLVWKDRTIFRVNRQAEILLEYPRSELEGQLTDILVPEELREKHVEHMQSFFRHPLPRPMGLGRQLAARKKDGSMEQVTISLSPLITRRGMLANATIRRKE